jgi:hypothetical protein
MNQQSSFLNQEGFTIQELLVTLIVGSLLVDFCFSLFLYSDKLFVSWQQRSESKDRVNSTLQIITTDILGSKRMVMISDSSIVLQKIDNLIVSYFFGGKSIRRGDVVLSEGNMEAALVSTQTSKSADAKPSNQVLVLKMSLALRDTLYQISTEVEIPYSSKEEFERSQRGIQ